jgi:hypothetical protein
LKFSDVIVAVASMTVIFILLDTLLWIALIPINSAWADPANIVVILVSALIVGYVFAGKIREESRMTSIGKVVVLHAVVTLFVVMMFFATVGHYNAYVDEYLRNTYSTGSWTNAQWFANEGMVLLEDAGTYVALALALGFVGLYVGSMRKPSAKTKE